MKRKSGELSNEKRTWSFGDEPSRDVTLVVGQNGEKFHVHLGVLLNYIPWFCAADLSGMSEHQSKFYMFPDDDVEAWLALLKRVYPPNARIADTDVGHVVALVDKYGIDWLKPEIVETSKKLERSHRSGALIDVLVRAGLNDVLDAWVNDLPWSRVFFQNPKLADEVQTLDGCRFVLKAALKTLKSHNCNCMEKACPRCNCCAQMAVECRMCQRSDRNSCTRQFEKGKPCSQSRCSACGRCK